MSKTAHTPTPLVAVPSIPAEGFECYWLRVGDRDIGSIDGPISGEQAEYAAFIVRAVNAHDALVSALEEALRRSRDMHFKSGPDGDRQHREAYAEQYAALAAASENTEVAK